MTNKLTSTAKSFVIVGHVAHGPEFLALRLLAASNHTFDFSTVATFKQRLIGIYPIKVAPSVMILR